MSAAPGALDLENPSEPDGGAAPADWDEEGSWLDRLSRPELGPVSWLGELAPSGRLMTELEVLPADSVEDDYDAVEMVAHWDRLEAYCAARKRLAAAALARRQDMAAGLPGLDDLPRGRGAVSAQHCVAGDELGLRLGISKRAAARLIASGRSFGGVGILTAEALAAGEICASKADMIVEGVRELPADAALEVQERVLDRASHLPPTLVQRELNAACAGIDTADYEARCAAERSTRRVCRPRPLMNGMAGIYAVLPAVEAGRLYRSVDAAARSAKARGDSRTLDQLRADALALMGSMAAATGWIGPAPETVCGTEDETAAAQSAEPGSERERARTLASHGSRMRSPSRENSSTRRREARVEHRGEVCPGGASPPASMKVGAIGGRSAHVRVVVPLTLLMADPQADRAGIAGQKPAADAAESRGGGEPAHLEGYGPIPASVARALAAGSTWARLVTDPVDGSVRDLSAATYRPPAAMADLVRAERPVCVRPGCAVEADSCDLNHDIPWPVGATEVDNLDPLCRRDHLLITHGGWCYDDIPSGEGTGPAASGRESSGAARRWRTGSGHRYTETPEGALTMTGPRVVRPSADAWDAVVQGSSAVLGAPPF